MTYTRLTPLREVFALHGENRGIVLGLWWNLVLLVGTLAALPFDHRTILGLDPWIKPLKFELSGSIYLATVAMLLAVLGQASSRWRRTRAAICWGTSIAMVVENWLIALQSARGVRSHMNYTSALDGAIFAVMGIFIAVNTALLVALLVLFCVAPLLRPRAEVWGIRLGLAVIIAGSLEGAAMVAHGSHTVGAADGGAGLAFFNWSTQYGDLRVAHFLALHALQSLWGAGWLLGRGRLPERLAVAATWVTACGYAAVVWLLFAQAMAGRPFLALR